MKKLMTAFLLGIIALCGAQEEDYSETPFVEAMDKSGNKISLPLKDISATVNIAGTIADVKSKQVYVNNTDSTINATYVFPGSSKAAVYGMTMMVEDRVVEAKIMEKQEAQATFDKAVKEGKTASLLTQHRPNVFQMNLGNIPAGEKIEIELNYTELLVPRDGVYEFVYPTIVGKRYDKEQVSGETWTLNPFANLDQDSNPNFDLPQFDITVNLNTPVAMHGVNITSHKTNIDYEGNQRANITLDNGGKTDNKDFILRYKLQDAQISTGLMLYEGEDENFFLYMGEAPQRVMPESIPEREYFFIVDVSGSMNGFPLDVSKEMMKNLLTGLRPEDKFNILLFASSSSVFSRKPVIVNKKNIDDALEFIQEPNGSGGTNMLSALKEAFKMKGSNSSRSMVILTDGFVTVEKEAFDFINKHLGDANFFSFGIGSSVNRFIIEGIAHIGHTEPFIITSKKDAERKAELFRKYISTPVLAGIDLKVDGLETYDIIPSHVPDLMAEKPVVIYGKYRGKAKGKFTLTGTSGNGKYSNTTRISHNMVSSENTALKYLWARKKVQMLGDYNKLDRASPLKDEITSLGLKYNLLTDYTSFVAIDNKPIPETQAPLPSGGSGSAPEPHEWALIFLIGGLLFFLYFKQYGFQFRK